MKRRPHPGLNALQLARRAEQGERRRAETRAKLMRAAYRLFADHGIDAPTIDDIVEAAGVARGSFYNHFESRETIFAAVADEIATGINAMIAPQLEVLTDPAERVSVALRIFVHFAVLDRGRGWILLRTMPLIGPLNPDMKAFIEAEFTRAVVSGRFRGKSVATVIDMALGVLIMTINRMLTDSVDDSYIQDAAEGFLVAMGLDDREAEAIAHLTIDFEGMAAPS